jgi:hypothetical protein
MHPKPPTSDLIYGRVAPGKVQDQLRLGCGQISTSHEFSHMLLVGHIAGPPLLRDANICRGRPFFGPFSTSISCFEGISDLNRMDSQSLDLPAQFVARVRTIGLPYLFALGGINLRDVAITAAVNKDGHDSSSGRDPILSSLTTSKVAWRAASSDTPLWLRVK